MGTAIHAAWKAIELRHVLAEDLTAIARHSPEALLQLAGECVSRAKSLPEPTEKQAPPEPPEQMDERKRAVWGDDSANRNYFEWRYSEWQATGPPTITEESIEAKAAGDLSETVGAYARGDIDRLVDSFLRATADAILWETSKSKGGLEDFLLREVARLKDDRAGERGTPAEDVPNLDTTGPQVERPALTPEERHAAVIAELKELNEAISRDLEPHAERLRGILEGLDLRTFGSQEANKEVVNALAAIMRRLEMGVICPKDESPSLLINVPSKGQKDGAYRFIHPEERDGEQKQAQHGGFDTYAELKLVPRPYKWDARED